jgi:hypothetical protein
MYSKPQLLEMITFFLQRVILFARHVACMEEMRTDTDTKL